MVTLNNNFIKGLVCIFLFNFICLWSIRHKYPNNPVEKRYPKPARIYVPSKEVSQLNRDYVILPNLSKTYTGTALLIITNLPFEKLEDQLTKLERVEGIDELTIYISGKQLVKKPVFHEKLILKVLPYISDTPVLQYQYALDKIFEEFEHSHVIIFEDG